MSVDANSSLPYPAIAYVWAMSIQILSGLSPPINSRMGAFLPLLNGEATIPFRGQDRTEPDLERSYQSLEAKQTEGG